MRIDGTCRACSRLFRDHVVTGDLCECRAILYPCDAWLQRQEPDVWKQADSAGRCRDCGQPMRNHFQFSRLQVVVMGRSVEPVHEVRFMAPVAVRACSEIREDTPCDH